jgi:hypothetical protein
MPVTQRAISLSLTTVGALVVALCCCPGTAFAEPDPKPPPAAASATDGLPSGPPIRVPTAKAEAPPPVPIIDYTTQRTEVAGAPLIGGNSDIGFQFGAVGTVTRFGDGIVPYRWNMDLVLAASLKNGANGLEIAQQSYLFQLDMPDLVPDRLRLKVTVSYQHTIDLGYFGLGNASSSEVPADAMGEPHRYFQFDQHEVVLRSLSRIVLRRPYELMVSTNFRYVDPMAYTDSKLARDAAQGAVRGLRSLVPLAVGVGIGYDSRDNEFFPNRGAFHQIGLKVAYALPGSASVQYGAFGTVVAGYMPIAGPLVFAARGVVDLQFGHVPFYDLFTGGVFQTQFLPGGPEGVRGVPVGRYLGLIKLVANVELRALLYEFHLLGAAFHLGGNVFADTGRVWEDYHFHNPADGTGIGLKWGTGLGAYLQWGQAAIFRAEFAYSPDAAALSPSFPLGVYVSDGVMF